MIRAIISLLDAAVAERRSRHTVGWRSIQYCTCSRVLVILHNVDQYDTVKVIPCDGDQYDTVLVALAISYSSIRCYSCIAYHISLTIR